MAPRPARNIMYWLGLQLVFGGVAPPRLAAPRFGFVCGRWLHVFPLAPGSVSDVGAMAKSTFPQDSLLTALPADLSSALFAKAHDVSLAADQIVFLAGDAGDGCYRIEDGLLKVSVSAAAGGERILAILGPGSIVGELSMIDGAPRSASVSALRDAKLRFVSRAAFEAFGRSNPEVHRHVMILLARRLRDTNDALAATSFLPVKGRVARALLNLAEAFGRDVGSGRIVLRQKVTQSDLAAMAGIARENVSRILKEWMDLGHSACGEFRDDDGVVDQHADGQDQRK